MARSNARMMAALMFGLFGGLLRGQGQSAESETSSIRPAIVGLPSARARQRTGVTLAPEEDTERSEEERRTGALSPRALRRLSVRPEGNTLRELGRWPPEPETPASVEPERLAAALRELCPPILGGEQFRRIADEITSVGARFGVDPMLLGALVYHQSDCDPTRQSSWGAGLAMLNRGLVPASVARGELHYTVRDAEGVRMRRSLKFDPPDRAAPDALLDPVTNLRIAGALLRMYREQCPELDPLFHSLPHRHHVSHFIWGDRVRGSGPEDSILTARRRLIDYYLSRAEQSGPTVALGALVLASPLDGAPRIVTSGLGEAREGGKRAHAGVDFLSREGEPVRACADGVVRRAGTDLADGSLVDVARERAALVPARAMGARGLFVEIAHEDGYRSIYAHLLSYTVEPGMKVQRGQRIGYVGRSGVRASDPHLHFGLFQGSKVVDPRRALGPLLFAPRLELREPGPQRAVQSGSRTAPLGR